MGNIEDEWWMMRMKRRRRRRDGRKRLYIHPPWHRPPGITLSVSNFTSHTSRGVYRAVFAGQQSRELALQESRSFDQARRRGCDAVGLIASRSHPRFYKGTKVVRLRSNLPYGGGGWRSGEREKSRGGNRRDGEGGARLSQQEEKENISPKAEEREEGELQANERRAIGTAEEAKKILIKRRTVRAVYTTMGGVEEEAARRPCPPSFPVLTVIYSLGISGWGRWVLLRTWRDVR